MHNPYQSPESTQTPSPETRPRRPISVWLLLLLFAFFAAAFAIGLGRFLLLIGSHAADAPNRSHLIVDIVWRMVLLAITGAAMFGFFQRQQTGRWFGIVVIIAIAAFSIFGPDSSQYSSDAERAGGALARFVLMPSLLVWWCYAFGFSAKAKLYWR
jgi:hypothetical protein